jgi:hypothetical protein
MLEQQRENWANNVEDTLKVVEENDVNAKRELKEVVGRRIYHRRSQGCASGDGILLWWGLGWLTIISTTSEARCVSITSSSLARRVWEALYFFDLHLQLYFSRQLNASKS